MRKFINNLVFDVFIYSIIAYSFLYGEQWMKLAATNIIYFLSFCSFFIAMCCLLMSKESLIGISNQYKDKTNWHKAYLNISCVAECLLLAAFGWWWCCGAFVLNAAGRSRLSDIAEGK